MTPPDGTIDLRALINRVAVTKGWALQDAAQQVDAWLSDPANVWGSQADILAAFGITPTTGDIHMDEATQTAMVEMEAKQNGLLTDLIKQIRTGNWGQVDAIYCALKGGIAKPDYTPTFP